MDNNIMIEFIETFSRILIGLLIAIGVFTIPRILVNIGVLIFKPKKS